VTNAIRGVTSLVQALATLQESLRRFESSLSVEALPSLQHVSALLGKIDSIFDPLRSLLEAEQCVDPSSAQKTWRKPLAP
jgi:hypothetical protein